MTRAKTNGNGDSKKSEPELLCNINFPSYCIGCVSPRHIIIAGGGGAANTGVKNGFEIFELSHNGKATTAKSVTKYDTKSFAVMNMACSKYEDGPQVSFIAVGLDDKTQIYRLQMARKRTESLSQEYKNGSPANKSYADHNGLTRLAFNVFPMNSVQTDYNMPEPYQKVVRLSPNNHFMATGGDDGFIRIWTFPDLYRTHEIEAHEKEIDDMDFSPDNSKLVTISKDRRAYVWDVKKGKKHAEIGWEGPKGVKYMFKRVRFGRVEGDSNKYKVFSISNPVAAPKARSFLQRFDGKIYELEQSRPFNGSLSALAVSDNGHFVAIGTMMDGTVEIFLSYNLDSIKRVENSHATFVTGLEFLSTSEETEIVRGFNEASLISISVDNQVCIHHIPRLRTISLTTGLAIAAMVLISVFILCSYLGL